ncbi:MAG: RNA polymerase sigma factor [Actinomycetota bacterium]|jgi:RNA polymerase sigma-70 factor (ECF subfamily)|nr:RNA polymerase sigma factor [Actinomycetota bacterium]
MGAEPLEEVLINEMKIVFRSLIKMGVTKEDTEDIVQNTLYKALKYIDSIEVGAARAWLFRVAFNEFYNLCRKNKKNVSINLSDIDITDLATESSEDTAIISEKVKDIRKTLEKLQPVFKELLILKYIIGFSYRDISEFKGYSEEKVKIYLYRARKKFKKLWERSEF